MPANTQPIFPLTPTTGVHGVLLTAAMTNTKAFDGTEATGAGKKELCYTAGANGARVDDIELRYTSTAGATASGTTNATLARFWINNGGADTTAANNQLLGEVEIPAAAVTALGTSKLPILSLRNVIGRSVNLPAGYKIYVGLTVAIGGTNCAIQPAPIAGDY